MKELMYIDEKLCTMEPRPLTLEEVTREYFKLKAELSGIKKVVGIMGEDPSTAEVATGRLSVDQLYIEELKRLTKQGAHEN